MTEKELSEIKRRLRPEKSNIGKIYGCFVNTNGEIIYEIEQSIALSDSVVSEKLLAVMKKSLSGSLGVSLHEIDFSTRDVTEDERHKLLMQLREEGLGSRETLRKFFGKVAESLHFETNYVILIANDVYDVFSRTSDGETADSTERFSYLITAVCPIKSVPETLTFREADSLFHTGSGAAQLASPALGFMFPAFDDRRTNIYSAIYYTKSTSECYADFCENIFGKSAPMPPKHQRAAFNTAIAEALDTECSFEAISAVNQRISDMVEAHRESKNPEPLVITKATVEAVLSDTGVSEEAVKRAGEAIDEGFGEGSQLSPKNIVNTKKFELVTPDVTVKVNPERRDLVTVESRDGVRYIVIRADAGVEVNGININIGQN